MKQLLSCLLGCVLSVALAGAAEKWNGKIGDSSCGATHKSAAEHGGKKLSDRDCTLACVKEHGGKYIFVMNGKAYNIDNQSFAGLEEHAGHNVKMTGEMKGDTITVSKIEMGKGKPDKTSE